MGRAWGIGAGGGSPRGVRAEAFAGVAPVSTHKDAIREAHRVGEASTLEYSTTVVLTGLKIAPRAENWGQVARWLVKASRSGAMGIPAKTCDSREQSRFPAQNREFSRNIWIPREESRFFGSGRGACLVGWPAGGSRTPARARPRLRSPRARPASPRARAPCPAPRAASQMEDESYWKQKEERTAGNLTTSSAAGGAVAAWAKTLILPK